MLSEVHVSVLAGSCPNVPIRDGTAGAGLFSAYESSMKVPLFVGTEKAMIPTIMNGFESTAFDVRLFTTSEAVLSEPSHGTPTNVGSFFGVIFGDSLSTFARR